MSITIGINPLTWSNDDLPALGSDVPLETCLEQAAAAGYAGVELGHKFPRRAETLRPLLERHGLGLVSGWYSLRLLERTPEEEFAAMQPHLELLQAFGCEVMVCAEVTGCIHGDINARLSARPRLTPSELARYAARLSQLAATMRARDMRLAFHHHMGTVIQSESDVDALMEAAEPEVELLLDAGHLMFAGGDPARVAARHAGRVAHLHCKDIRRPVLERCLNRDASFLEAVLQGAFTVPGDGCIDFGGVLAPLLEGGYAGWAVVEAEQDPAIADPVTCATLGYTTLRHLIGP